MLGGDVDVDSGGAGGGLRGPHSPDCAKIDQRLRDTGAQVDGVDRTKHDAPRIEERLAGRTLEVEA
ncbi:MAG: hypothetical protein U0163_14790 [Gemmatimonadaceae bacterium]